MVVTPHIESLVALASAVGAILMLGTTRLTVSLRFYTLHTLCLSAITLLIAESCGSLELSYVAMVVLALKAFFIPVFFLWIIRKVDIQTDSNIFIPAPLCMHLGIVLLGLSYYLLSTTPREMCPHIAGGFIDAAAMSLVFTGILQMLTRKLAISQVLGFLVLENGIYLFAVTQTHGMPMMMEMASLLEILVAVMIAGLLIFRIKKSFEHIDVTQLTGLQD